MTLRREQVNLAEVIAGALAVVGPLVEKKNLDMQVEIPDGLPEVYCDRTRIRQVILNLVSNAARFTERGGIRIQVRDQEEHVVVSVIDTGPGIPPEDAERVFEPFWQGMGNPWRDKAGSGLGLSISKQLVEQHGGRIWLESSLGIGSTFFFSLPTSEPRSHTVRPGHWIKPEWMWARHPAGTAFLGLASKPRVIICDATSDLYSAFSQYDSEVEFVETQDLAQAALELKRCPAHALVLNAQSPSDLWPLIERAGSEMPDTPIIGCSVPSRMEHALKAGAMGYLMKPVTRADLGGAVRAVGRHVKRILVVDDDPDVLQLLTRLLQALDPTLEITAAPGGAQALDELRSKAPDLMLLDIMMRGMDGWEVLAVKARDDTIRDIPVMLISAQDPEEKSPSSLALLATMGRGLSLSDLLRCSLGLSALLLAPGKELDPGLV